MPDGERKIVPNQLRRFRIVNDKTIHDYKTQNGMQPPHELVS